MSVGSGKRRGDWRSSKGHSSDFHLAKKIHEKKSSSWGKKEAVSFIFTMRNNRYDFVKKVGKHSKIKKTEFWDPRGSTV